MPWGTPCRRPFRPHPRTLAEMTALSKRSPFCHHLQPISALSAPGLLKSVFATATPGSSRKPRCTRLRDQYANSRRRTEEHTFELQSLMRISYAVFCLKKKNEHHREQHTHDNIICQSYNLTGAN